MPSDYKFRAAVTDGREKIKNALLKSFTSNNTRNMKFFALLLGKFRDTRQEFCSELNSEHPSEDSDDFWFELINLHKLYRQFQLAVKQDDALSINLLRSLENVVIGTFLGDNVEYSQSTAWIQPIVDYFVNTVNEVNTRLYSDKGGNKEAPKSASLGAYAFPSEREDEVLSGDISLEKDTSTEERLLADLTKHFDGTTSASTPETFLTKRDVQIIRNILTKGYYKKIFHGPEVSRLYRGMSVSEKWLHHALQIDAGVKLPKEDERRVNVTYEPLQNVSSWTSSMNTAFDFAKDNISGSGNKTFAIVLSADVADNSNSCFVAGPDGLYNLDKFKRFNPEKEFLGLSKIKVNRISWKHFNLS